MGNPRSEGSNLDQSDNLYDTRVIWTNQMIYMIRARNLDQSDDLYDKCDLCDVTCWFQEVMDDQYEIVSTRLTSLYRYLQIRTCPMSCPISHIIRLGFIRLLVIYHLER